MLLRAVRRLLVPVVSVLVALPGAAAAAGFDIPEDGALSLAQGGTVTGLLGTGYALQFNPAGMALVDGLDARVDARAVSHDIAFKRADREKPNGNVVEYERVENSAGPYVAPRASVAWRLPGKLDFLAVGLGGWGPPGVGVYTWPDPVNLEKTRDRPEGLQGDDLEAATGNRYSTIASEIFIAMFGAGAAARLLDGKLALGATFAAVYADVGLTQSILAVPFSGVDIDARIKLAAKDSFTPAGIVGAIYQPLKGLRVAASLRTAIPLSATGTVGIVLPELATTFGVSARGDKVTLEQKLPPVGRLGVSYARGRFAGTLEATWEGWSAVQTMIITPQDIFLVTKNQDGTEKETRIEVIRVEKHWVDSFGARLGGSALLLEPAESRPSVSVLAGALFESNAIPEEYQGVDFVTGHRAGATLGVTSVWKGFQLTLGGVYYPKRSVTVDGSVVKRTAASSDPEGQIIGNGVYDTSAWAVALGLGWTGLAPAAK